MAGKVQLVEDMVAYPVYLEENGRELTTGGISVWRNEAISFVYDFLKKLDQAANYGKTEIKLTIHAVDVVSLHEMGFEVNVPKKYKNVSTISKERIEVTISWKDSAFGVANELMNKVERYRHNGTCKVRKNKLRKTRKEKNSAHEKTFLLGNSAECTFCLFEKECPVKNGKCMVYTEDKCRGCAFRLGCPDSYKGCEFYRKSCDDCIYFDVCEGDYVACKSYQER